MGVRVSGLFSSTMNAEKATINIRGVESSYAFESIEKVTVDFLTEVKRMRSERER